MASIASLPVAGRLALAVISIDEPDYKAFFSSGRAKYPIEGIFLPSQESTICIGPEGALCCYTQLRLNAGLLPLLQLLQFPVKLFELFLRQLKGFLLFYLLFTVELEIGAKLDFLAGIARIIALYL